MRVAANEDDLVTGRRPGGKHAGTAAEVNCRRADPSMRIVQIWLVPETALANTTCAPSGDGNGVTNDVPSRAVPSLIAEELERGARERLVIERAKAQK